jgi:hypothetical protein
MRIVSYIAAVVCGGMLAIVATLLACWAGAESPSRVRATGPIRAAAATPQLPPQTPAEKRQPLEPRYLALDPAGIAERLGGGKVADILRHPDRVTSALLTPSIHHRSTLELEPRTEEVVVAAEVAATIAEALLDPARNRQVNASKPCFPRYGWQLTYCRDDDRVYLYVCFECMILHAEHEGRGGGLHIDEIGPELHSAALAIFPGDEALAQVAPRGRN